MKCSTCGTRTDTKAARKAHDLATGHGSYEPVVSAPVARTSWDDRVDAMVAEGWSREFAESFVPMSTAEAKARGLTVRSYQSPMTALTVRRSSR